MIIVDSSTRQFTVPATDQIFGVEADAGSEVKYFQAPRYVGNKLDLAGSFLRINYRNPNGDKDSYLIQDVTVDGDKILFSWTLTPKVTAYKGEVKYVLCATGPDLKVAWHTTLGSGKVLEGMESDNSHVEEETSDVVAQLVAMVEAQTAVVEAAGAAQVAFVEAATAAQIEEIEAKGKNVRDSIPEDYAALSAAVATLAPGIVCEAEGTAITLNDSSDKGFRGMRIFGKSVQNGIPSPAAPVEIVSIENPTVSVDDQTITIPRTIPGIPVATGGNYTDATGQQWICDEVDLGRGVYVQRIVTVKVNANMVFRIDDIGKDSAQAVIRGIYHKASDSGTKHLTLTDPILSNRYVFATWSDNPWAVENSISYNDYTDVRVKVSATETLESYKEFVSTNDVRIAYIRIHPIETPISETEIAAYRALHTNKPNTTIITDSGAHMAVEYVADTKLYIDNLVRRN